MLVFSAVTSNSKPVLSGELAAAIAKSSCKKIEVKLVPFVNADIK